MAKQLYKYRKIDKNSLSCLANGEIWLSKRKNLNDPFDLLEPRYDFSNDEVEYFFRSRYGEEVSSGRQTAHQFNIFLDEAKRLQLDWPNKGKAVAEEMYQAFGLYSMSAVVDDILMWSHYSDGHAGMCIEFERNNVQEFQDQERGFFKVKYPEDEKFPDINILEGVYPETYREFLQKIADGTLGQARDPSYVLTMIATKSIHWKYEEEWRYMDEGGEEKGDLGWKIPIEEAGLKITGITFGLETTPDDISLVQSIVGEGVSYSKAHKKDGYFKLDIKPLK